MIDKTSCELVRLVRDLWSFVMFGKFWNLHSPSARAHLNTFLNITRTHKSGNALESIRFPMHTRQFHRSTWGLTRLHDFHNGGQRESPGSSRMKTRSERPLYRVATLFVCSVEYFECFKSDISYRKRYTRRFSSWKKTWGVKNLRA